jgi:3-oxoacid CoA-transferase subunit B
MLPPMVLNYLERAPGVTVEEIKNKTAGKLIVPDCVPEMVI